MKNKILFKLNYYYSIIYIAITRTDKFYYRDNSKVHQILLNSMEV
jgi:hypothetical protein